MMNRRNFVKTAVASMMGATVARGAFGAVKVSDVAESSAPYKSKFAPHFGMMKESVKGLSFEDQLQFFYDCGFRALEDNGMMNRPVEVQTQIAKKMESLGMEMGVSARTPNGSFPLLRALEPTTKGALRAIPRRLGRTLLA